MILDNSLKIISFESSSSTVESDEFAFDNYDAVSFLFNNPKDSTTTVKVKANTENGKAEYVPFKMRAGEKNIFADIDADGKEVTDCGAFVAIVTANSLLGKDFDRVSVELSGGGDMLTVYVLLMQPKNRNKATIGEVKQYLGLDGDDNNKVLDFLISSAEHLVEKVLRQPIQDDTPEIVKTAVLFTVWQLYFHRDSKEFDSANLEATLAVMLSDLRKMEF